MPTTRYTVIDGEILSENRAGVKRDYVPDPLGSTLALLDNTQTQTDTFSYYPYGEVASRTGTTATPFQYIGTLGYYQDNSGRTYVRARHLRTAHGRWMTQDPIGFDGGDVNLYRYVSNMPMVGVDPNGMHPTISKNCSPKVHNAIGRWCKTVEFGMFGLDRAAVAKCVRQSGVHCQTFSFERQLYLSWFCDFGKVDCPPSNLLPTTGQNPCGANTCGYTHKQCPVKVPSYGCTISICEQYIATGGCWDFYGDKTIPETDVTVLHEMLHCAGLSHHADINRDDPPDCNDVTACCIINASRPPGSRRSCKRTKIK